MKLLNYLYHFLLFLIVSWTVYSSFIFICLILPASDNKYVELYIFDFWNLYLLGALDFHKLFTEFSKALYILLELRVLREFWPVLLYVFSINGMAAYIWCRNQNPLGALFLALAPCLAGPYLFLVFIDDEPLFFGMIGIFVFYVILYILNDYRKRHYPKLILPAWLEWRRPNMVPSLKSIVSRIRHMFSKRSS